MVSSNCCPRVNCQASSIKSFDYCGFLTAEIPLFCRSRMILLEKLFLFVSNTRFKKRGSRCSDLFLCESDSGE